MQFIALASERQIIVHRPHDELRVSYSQTLRLSTQTQIQDQTRGQRLEFFGFCNSQMTVRRIPKDLADLTDLHYSDALAHADRTE